MSDEGPAGDPGEMVRTVVVAAGGLVIDGTGAEAKVLVVHRPTHDDWSLPKGHVDPGERLEEAALREVAEETGVEARIVRSAGTTEHRVRLDDGPASKRVHWFVMRPRGDTDPESRVPDAEVDRATWWTVRSALSDLTYAGERTLLADVLTLR